MIDRKLEERLHLIVERLGDLETRSFEIRRSRAPPVVDLRVNLRPHSGVQKHADTDEQ